MKGILFRPEMISAIKAESKTQTRRVMGPQPFMQYGVLRWQPKKGVDINLTDHLDLALIFARYKVGEVVYIKETYWVDYLWPDKPTPETRYIHYKLGHDTQPAARMVAEDIARLGLWQTPLFMPEEAARYFIKITDIRAERLQEITWEDCKAEGIGQYTFARGCCSDNPPDPRWKFIEAWNSINAKWKRVYNKKLKIYEFWQFPWAEEDAVPIPKTTQHPERYHCIPNPFVFVYSFKKAEK